MQVAKRQRVRTGPHSLVPVCDQRIRLLHWIEPLAEPREKRLHFGRLLVDDLAAGVERDRGRRADGVAVSESPVVAERHVVGGGHSEPHFSLTFSMMPSRVSASTTSRGLPYTHTSQRQTRASHQTRPLKFQPA